MKLSRLYVVALAALVAAGACSQPPTAPSTIVITNNNTNTNNNGQPTGTPSPGTGGPGVLDHVDISQFGENCPSGSGPADWKIGDPPHVHVGCTAVITCSPRDSAGKDIPNPPTPELFGLVGGNAQVDVRPSSSNPGFNRDVIAKTAGTATLACTVAGKGSGAWNLAVQ